MTTAPSIPPQTAFAVFEGAGTRGPFPLQTSGVDWTFANVADIKAIRIDADLVAAAFTDFSVSPETVLDETSAGASLTIADSADALAVGEQLIVYRQTTPEGGYAPDLSGAINLAALAVRFNRIAEWAQDAIAQISRTVRVSFASAVSGEIALDDEDEMADAVLTRVDGALTWTPQSAFAAGPQGEKGDKGDPGASGDGSGDMIAAQNLSDVADLPTAMENVRVARPRVALTGTSHAISAAYLNKHVTFSNAAAIAASLAQAGSTGFNHSYSVLAENIGAGVVTITPATSTINGAASLTLYKGQWALITSDGTNYRALLGGLAPETLEYAISDETTDLTTGTAKLTARAPYALRVLAARASLTHESSSGALQFDVNEGGASIFSTPLTIDASEKTSTSAATPAVISDPLIADDAEITFDIDTAGTGAKGAKIRLSVIRVP